MLVGPELAPVGQDLLELRALSGFLVEHRFGRNNLHFKRYDSRIERFCGRGFFKISLDGRGNI